MNRDLVTLRDHAAARADTDPDVAARPLWTQIATEVDAYLTDAAPPEPEGPDLFLFGEVES